MEIKGTNSFFFKDDCYFEELSIFLETPRPSRISSLSFYKTFFDFNYGNFCFTLQKGKNEKIEIHFQRGVEDIKRLWLFLEAVYENKEPLILKLFYKGEETLLYAETKDKTDLRFAIVKYGEEKELAYDVLISKRRFIKQFYTELVDTFKSYENVAYFEPPFIDFDSWVKDSKKLKAYLKPKKKG